MLADKALIAKYGGIGKLSDIWVFALRTYQRLSHRQGCICIHSNGLPRRMTVDLVSIGAPSPPSPLLETDGPGMRVAMPWVLAPVVSGASQWWAHRCLGAWLLAVPGAPSGCCEDTQFKDCPNTSSMAL